MNGIGFLPSNGTAQRTMSAYPIECDCGGKKDCPECLGTGFAMEGNNALDTATSSDGITVVPSQGMGIFGTTINNVGYFAPVTIVAREYLAPPPLRNAKQAWFKRFFSSARDALIGEINGS